ncbi:tripartite motif-containing protein 16-like [Centropristis striata]|uniref:tripartite motif-containing protein 16-like n=1 Tax=Centropristis striata TaxID=184440 RepID=UPI0027E117CD|nr:tripartite motif-containing protein 16-like [Centropristis striata]
MAQQRNQADEMKFCCSICLDLLKDPVTIPCGHNYCMSCIKAHWDKEGQKKCHSCPQCRQTFNPRPALVKNTMLAELVDEKKNVPADHCYARPGDVVYDFGTGRNVKVVEASVKLQDNICSLHNKLKEIYCRTDQQCICILCLLDDHKGHDKVSAVAERTEKQKKLGESRQRIQQRVQDREKDLKKLQEETETINHSADKAVEDSEKIFTELICLIEKRRSDGKQQIRSQQETDVSQIKDLQEKLNQEITELKRKDAELEHLSRTEDHTHFLHGYPSLSELPESTDSPRPNIYCLQYFEDVVAALTAARDKMHAILTGTWSLAEPTTRAEFLRYSREITLDPNTAGRCLVLSEGNRKVTFDGKNKPYPKHPERFSQQPQVLSKDGLTGRCYWEVTMSKDARVAVAYKSISRSGDIKAHAFGFNKKSWALYCFDVYTFMHDNHSVSISGPVSSRIGVYLDHRAGILSFYSVSKTMTLLHRVQTTFTEPLHAGVYVYGSDGDTAEFCKLE